MSEERKIRSKNCPEFLKKGDTIGVISTARKISREELQPAIYLLEDLGYKCKLGQNLFLQDNQFAGTSLERASDLHDMFADKSVKAILCARGGYGTVQLIPHLDLDIISKNPKWLIGYSDVTVLHSFLHENTQVQSLHATMPINFALYQKTDLPISSMFNILEGKEFKYEISSSVMNKTGIAEGVIVGGNLSILYSLRGTNADVDTDGKILFIEDLDEYLYHIDRIMMNLKIGGKLKDLKALIVGGMNDMNDNDTPFGKSAKEIIRDAVGEYDYPVLFDFPAGHIHNNYALPLGRNVKLEINSDITVLSSY